MFLLLWHPRPSGAPVILPLPEGREGVRVAERRYAVVATDQEARVEPVDVRSMVEAG